MSLDVTAPDHPHLPAPRHPGGPYLVLMVCTGNICRSAMAEIILRDRLALSSRRAGSVPGGVAHRGGSAVGHGAPLAGSMADGPGGPHVLVTSAGVSDEERGNPMDSRAIRVLREAGYDADPTLAQMIAAHRAHRVTDEEILTTDLVLAMTSSHHAALTRRAERLGADPDRIRMFRELDPDAAEQAAAVSSSRHGARSTLDVPDPWYGTMADFLDTLEVVERVSNALAPALVTRCSGA